MKIVEEVLKKYDYQKENLLPILLEVQNMSEGRYVTKEVARYIADKVKIPYAQIYEVTSFFAAINKGKKGVYHIELCDSTVCGVNKKDDIELYLEDSLKIKAGETTDDGLFTLDHAPCFGACDVSPSVRINKQVYSLLTVDKMAEIIEDLRRRVDG